MTAGSIDPIVPSGATGSGLGNYTIVYVNGWLTVNPATLTITAHDDSKTYGTLGSFSSTAFTETGLVTANGDTITGVTETSAGTPVSAMLGTYPIVPSGATGSGLDNYTIGYVNGTLRILQSSTFSSLEGPILRSTVRSPVTFTVDVSSSSEGSIPLMGVVAFYDQAQMFGAAPVVNGIATLSTSALAEGNYMVYAEYQGNANYQPSSTGTIVQMVMSTAPADPVKRATPIPAHPKKTTPKPKAPAPKPKAHPVVKPKAHPATKPRAAVAVKTHVKVVVRTKR